MVVKEAMADKALAMVGWGGCRFDPVVKLAPTLVPDGFIYLRAQPQTCMSRMQQRNRNEETGVGIDYLQDLHDRHENWLCHKLGESAILHPSQVTCAICVALYNTRRQFRQDSAGGPSGVKHLLE
jgi:hypothetical protein